MKTRASMNKIAATMIRDQLFDEGRPFWGFALTRDSIAQELGLIDEASIRAGLRQLMAVGFMRARRSTEYRLVDYRYRSIPVTLYERVL